LGEHIALDLHFEPGLPPVKADSGMVEQIIMNLAVNARDAMANGGQVTISTRPMTVEAGSPRGQHAGKYVCLTVADNGSGMDPETMSRIFEPFFTTKEVGKGSGLGLATVYGIVEQHSGWIEVESTLGKGTVFKSYLPVATETSQAVANMDPGNSRNLENGTVLVAEDEASVLGLVTSILHRGGYKVIGASSGDDAWLLWEQHADEIDMLVTDMVMPGILSGKGLAERIHEQKPSLPVIYSSGYSLEIVREGLVLKEGVNFLPKPYPPATLLKMVRECLAQSRRQGGADTRAI
jgi:CheY-like chemotaxis protein